MKAISCGTTAANHICSIPKQNNQPIPPHLLPAEKQKIRITPPSMTGPAPTDDDDLFAAVILDGDNVTNIKELNTSENNLQHLHRE